MVYSDDFAIVEQRLDAQPELLTITDVIAITGRSRQTCTELVKRKGKKIGKSYYISKQRLIREWLT